MHGLYFPTFTIKNNLFYVCKYTMHRSYELSIVTNQHFMESISGQPYQAALAADAAAGAGPVEPPPEPKPPEPAEAPEPEVDSEAGGLAMWIWVFPK